MFRAGGEATGICPRPALRATAAHSILLDVLSSWRRRTGRRSRHADGGRRERGRERGRERERRTETERAEEGEREGGRKRGEGGREGGKGIERERGRVRDGIV